MQQVGTLSKAFNGQQPAQDQSVLELCACLQQAILGSTFVQESTTAPKLALGPVVFRAARAINWERVSSNPLPTGERLCTAIAVD